MREGERERERARAGSADAEAMSLADGRLRRAIIHEARDANKANKGENEANYPTQQPTATPLNSTRPAGRPARSRSAGRPGRGRPVSSRFLEQFPLSSINFLPAKNGNKRSEFPTAFSFSATIPLPSLQCLRIFEHKSAMCS